MTLDWFSRLHPALVHLPVGILLLAALIAWLGARERHRALLPALPLLCKLGAGAALLSCLSGWLLADSGGYEPELLEWHRRLGIATAVAAGISCFIPYPKWWLSVTAVLLTVAGHMGGALTHGEGYLSLQDAIAPRPADLQEAVLYSDIVSPILTEKCVGCHGAGKKKGGLRLDSPEAIARGGEHGQVIQSGHADSSALIRRCLLPPGHADHMPPKEKPQLSPEEISILQWWLNSGADFGKKVKELNPGTTALYALKTWQKGPSENAPELEIPDFPAPAPPAALLASLKKSGVGITPVGRGSQWLSVNLVNVQEPSDTIFSNLAALSEQIIWLNAAYCRAPASAWASIGRLKQLRRLHLEYSNVTDSLLTSLQQLPALQTLNLAGTQVSAQGIERLSAIKTLKKLYLYRSPGAHEAQTLLALKLPDLKIDTGAAPIPFLETDTARLKAPKVY